MATRRLDRDLRRADADHAASQAGELLGKESAAATNVERSQAGGIPAEWPGQQVTEVLEPSARDAPCNMIRGLSSSHHV